jgi:hypothetical protein
MPEWMRIVEPASKPTPQERAQPRPQRLSRYAEAAIDGAVKHIAGAAAGMQETTLNTESYSIGRRVADGVLPAGFALDALLLAAHSIQSHDRRRPWRAREIDRKVLAAFTDGLRHPRGRPDVRS